MSDRPAVPIRLADLAPRISILGPSSSGKSTLAVAIGRALTLPVIHLDQLRHEPGTAWVQRSDEEFSALHAAAIASDSWVMDGNYSAWIPERLRRSTGLIVLDAVTVASLGRYVRRTLFESSRRPGGLQGTRDRLSLGMVRFILGPARANRRRHRALVDSAGLPSIYIPTRSALADLYSSEHLKRTP